MPSTKTKYNCAWEKDYPWLKECEKDPYIAQCSFCKSNFKISISGIGQVKAHAAGKKHQNIVAVRKNETNQSVFLSTTKNNVNQLTLSSGNYTITAEEQIMKTEIIWALKCVSNNWSFASNNNLNDIFKMMFPDSTIASNYAMGETKCKYILQFGISVYVKELLLEDLKDKPFTFKFDETTTAQIKKQYDAYVQFFSNKHNRIINHYCGSLFVGHCTAAQLLEHFFYFVKLLQCDIKLLLHIGMDGPNVNKSFLRNLEKDLLNDHQKIILDIGTCSLHQVHNAYARALKCINFDFDQFSQDLYFFFKYSSARREDFLLVTLETELKGEYMIKHVSSRWISLKRVLSRILDQWSNLREYFLKFVPKEKNFAKEIEGTDRYKRIIKNLKCDYTKIYLSFAVYLAEELEIYLLKFQSDQPLVHMLYCQIGDLLFKLMSKFLKENILCKTNQNNNPIPQEAKDLGLIKPDSSENQKHIMNIEVGTNAKYLLSQLEHTSSLNQISKLKTEMKLCYVELVKDLQRHLPHQSTVLRDLQYLHPKMRLESKSRGVSAIGRLTCTITKVLKGRITCVFHLKDELNDGALSDLIQSQFRMYQLETAIESWSKDLRIDEYWSKVGEIKDIQGEYKYKELGCLSKCYLSLSHSNVAPERGFSLNKFLLEDKICLAEDTIIALRLIKDSLSLYTIDRFPFNKRLFTLVSNSRKQYMAYLENKKKEEHLRVEELNKKKQEEENVVINRKKSEGLEIQLEQKKKELCEEQIKLDIADKLIQDGNDALHSVINSKKGTVDKNCAIKAHAMISMGMEKGVASRKRTAELQDEISRLGNLLKKFKAV